MRRLLYALLGLALVVLAGACSSPGAPSRTRIDSVSPDHGTTFGGSTLTIRGANFKGTVTVSLGGAPATGVVLVSATELTAVTPPHAEGRADVTVSTVTESATLGGGFTFETPAVTNSPPRIVTLTARGTRRNEPSQYAAVNESIDLQATIVDDETPLSGLRISWSADRGAVGGSGASVTYRAPQAAGLATVHLEVVESFTAPDGSGRPVAAENRATADIQIDVHDEVNEVGDMAKDFLELFSQSSVAPLDVLRNFQDGCGANGTGRQDELQQTILNREAFVILPDWFVGTPATTIDFNAISPFRARHGDGWSSVRVRWRSQCVRQRQDESVNCPSAGFVQTPSGIDWVTARYDAPTKRWWLCDSDFQPD